MPGGLDLPAALPELAFTLAMISAQSQQACESKPFPALPHPQVRIKVFSCLQIKLLESSIENHAISPLLQLEVDPLLSSLENDTKGSDVGHLLSVSLCPDFPGLVTCGDEPPSCPLQFLPSDLASGRRLAWRG